MAGLRRAGADAGHHHTAVTELPELRSTGHWQPGPARARRFVRHATLASRRPAGQPVDGHGKSLERARELNVSSDIDLIYVYDQDGDGGNADGRHGVQPRIFRQGGRRCYARSATPPSTASVPGDLALRPNGSPVRPRALSRWRTTSSSRAVSGSVSPGRQKSRSAGGCRARPRPRGRRPSCVARRAALRVPPLPGLRRVRGTAGAAPADPRQAHRAAPVARSANDVKLSRGGIREIEFIVQLLQVRGGQFPELRTGPTLDAPPWLAAGRPDAAGHGRRLAEAYDFLRRVEHRIQYLDDQQTHVAHQ